MIDYNFISKGRLDGVVVDVAMPVKIPALSLKKAIAKFSPKKNCSMAVIYWTSRKGNESKNTYLNSIHQQKKRKGK